MDAFDDGDQSDSQATQLLQDLLEHDTDSSRRPSSSRVSALKSQNAHSNEFSSDSLPSSRTSNPLPQYHFHGLASTQTQSQMNDEEEAGEGSQKENMGAARLAKDVGCSNLSPTSRQASPNGSSSRNTQSRAEQVDVHAPSIRETRKKTSATVTFQSPRPKNGVGGPSKPVAQNTPYKPTAPSSRYKATPRPLSRTSSQDSFASEDPEEQFLTKSKKFELPLSQLATEPAFGARSLDVTGGTSNSSMFAFSPSTRRMRPPPSPPRGRILVEATPSQSSKSSSSQSQEEGQARLSQQFERTQASGENQQGQQRSMNTDEDDGYASSEPSSSYGRFLNGERDPEPELEATQPSTQPQDSHMFDADASPVEQRSSHPSGNTGTSANAQSSGPRSLLKMVRPENQWRYKKYQRQGSAEHPPRANPSNMSSLHPGGSSTPAVPLPSAGQETQPSHDEEPVDVSTYPFALNHLSHNSGNASLLACVPTTRITSPAIDSMDVIPDSEPLRSEEPSPKRRLLSPLPARYRVKPDYRDNIDYEMAPPLVEPRNGRDDEDIALEHTEEEEVPLAAAVSKKQRAKKPGKTAMQKGKGKLVQVNEADETVVVGRVQKGDNVGGRDKAVEPVAPPATTKLYPRSGPPPKMGQSWETGVIPSSVPDQDIVKPTRKPQSRATGQSSKTPKGSRRVPDSRKASTTVKRRGREATSEPEENGSEDELLLSPDQKQGSDDLTDEDYKDESGAGPSRKRKRASSSKTATSQSKKPTAAAKRSKRTQTAPGNAQQKQLRSAVSTNRKQVPREGTRVFALWRQDCHFYSGTIHSLISNGRYEVHFDDETVQDVPIDQMYRADLRIGDSVIVAGSAVTSHVMGFVDDEPDRVCVKHTTKNGTKELDLELSEIRIAFRTIKKDWQDRLLSTNSVVTSVKPVTKAKLSPSPSKQSVLSTPFGGDLQQTMLEGMGLIVTLNAVNGNWSEEKGNLRKTIQNNGGIVIEDLSTILQMDGKHTKNNHCWTIRKGDVRWIGRDEIERVLLIADDPTQKPKYLIALALGIPCISVEWLHECVQRGEYRDWDSHLLPQGLSTPLGARLSQQVDLDWGNSIHHLRDIMSNAAAAKLFAEKSILCVGPDMVPQPKGKKRPGVDEKAQDAINAVARIILSMGADRVEAVTDVKYATEDPSEYDLVVIREPEQYSPDVADGTTVHWTWVKECLIASRYLPYPDWPVACHSQEA